MRNTPPSRTVVRLRHLAVGGLLISSLAFLGSRAWRADEFLPTGEEQVKSYPPAPHRTMEVDVIRRAEGESAEPVLPSLGDTVSRGPESRCNVEVRAVDTQGRGISGANVTLTPALRLNGVTAISAETNAGGWVWMRGVEAVRYHLSVASQGRESLHGSLRPTAARVVRIGDERVTIRVRDRAGSPVEGACVLVVQRVENEPGGSRAVTDSDGIASLIANTTYESRGVVTCEDLRKIPFKIPAGTMALTVVLPRGIEITGTLDCDPKLYSGLSIVLSGREEVTVDGTGCFSMQAASECPLAFWVRGTGVLDVAIEIDWRGIRKEYGAIPATVHLGSIPLAQAHVARIQVSTIDSAAVVGALVQYIPRSQRDPAVRPGRQPLSGDRLWHKNAESEYSNSSALTDSRGIAEVDVSPTFEALLRVQHTLYSRWDGDLAINADSDVWRSVVLTRAAQVRIESRVLPPGFASDSHALLIPLTAERGAERNIKLERTSDGAWVGRGITPGDYELLIRGSGHCDEQRCVTVVEGENSWTSVLRPGAEIRGVVHRSDGASSAHAQVNLWDPHGSREWITRADENGKFSFLSAPPGARELELRAYVDIGTKMCGGVNHTPVEDTWNEIEVTIENERKDG